MENHAVTGKMTDQTTDWKDDSTGRTWPGRFSTGEVVFR